jgi:hypothetical protein
VAIAKGAEVILSTPGVERQGTVLREVDPHVVQGLNPGEEQVTRRYEVHLPPHGDLPEHTGVYMEDELTPVPRDSRA